MSKKANLTRLVILLSLTSFNVYGQLADTPWPMFRQNLQHTGQSSFNGPQSPEILWKFPTRDNIDASPAIDFNGNIIIGSNNGSLYSVNPNGTQKWRYETNGAIQSSASINEDGTIYFGSGDNNFYALNPDGSLKWKYYTDTYIYSSPVISSDGTVYFVASNYLFALNPDGTLRWRRELKLSESLLETPSPAIGKDGVIYISRDCFPPDNGILYAINPDSTTKWQFNSLDRFYSSPAIADDGTVYAGTYGNHYLYAINLDGTEKWKFGTGGRVWSSPAIGQDGRIYVGCDSGYLYSLDEDKGDMLWRFQTGGIINSSPVIGSDGIIYVGSSDSKIYGIDINGNELWEYETGGAVDSSPVLGEDGTLYVGSDDGFLYAIGGAYQVTFDLQKVPEKQYYHFGDTLQLFLNFQKSSNAMNVDIYFALFDSELGKLFFAPTWSSNPDVIIKNIYLPPNMSPINGAMIIEVNFPSDKPPINKPGDYSFAIAAAEPNTLDFISGIAFTSFTVQ